MNPNRLACSFRRWSVGCARVGSFDSTSVLIRFSNIFMTHACQLQWSFSAHVKQIGWAVSQYRYLRLASQSHHDPREQQKQSDLRPPQQLPADHFPRVVVDHQCQLRPAVSPHPATRLSLGEHEIDLMQSLTRATSSRMPRSCDHGGGALPSPLLRFSPTRSLFFLCLVDDVLLTLVAKSSRVQRAKKT